MRKVRLCYDGVYMIAAAAHQRDADRVLAEPWPFTWTPPGQHPDTLPWWWSEDLGGVEEWVDYHRNAVIGG
jgi:hypothetical protein